MLELPEGWVSATLPELIGAGGVITDGDWVESKDQDPTGSIRLTQLADIGDGFFRDRSARFLRPDQAARMNCTLLRPDDVMIARMPDPLGRACLFPSAHSAAVTVVDVCIVRLGQSPVSARWLMHSINSPDFRTSVASEQRGSTRKRVSKKSLCELALSVPPSSEQRLIVDEVDSYLSRLDAAVASLERVQAKLKAYRASVLKAAVEGRLVPTEAELARKEKRDYEPADVLLRRILAERRRRWEEAELAKLTAAGKPPKDDKWKSKYAEPAAPDTSELRALPEGWCWASVEQLCVAIVDCPHSTPQWTDSGLVCVRTTEFAAGQLDLATPRYVSEVTYRERIQRLRPEPGDVLYSREGGILGLACRVPSGAVLCLGQRMMLMRAADGLGAYLMHVLNSPMTLAVVRRLTGGSASPHLNVGEIRRFAIPLPPFDEAQRVVDAADAAFSLADVLDRDTARGLRRIARLRQSILKWAFEGKLVDQDPSDEPAEKLLARIRAERAAAVPAAKKPRRAKARR